VTINIIQSCATIQFVHSPLDINSGYAYRYSMITIREAREDELLKAAELWSEFMDFNAQFNDSFATRGKAVEIFTKEMMEKYPARDFRLAVADTGSELVGFCFSYISQKPKYFKLETFGFIGDLYVKPEYRRQGIGFDLVRDALNFFARRKVCQIELLVSIQNRDAIKFWEAIGFSHLLTWMYKRI